MTEDACPPPSPAPGRRGRPPRETAGAHAAILDAVYELLQTKSVRDLTMEEVAKRAKVGKPTLYKWWPSKAALVFAMFHERLDRPPPSNPAAPIEEAIRGRVRYLMRAFNGLFGKVMAELIAEGQSEPDILRNILTQHLLPRRVVLVAEIERAKASGDIPADTDTDVLIDALFGPIYLRLLLRHAPLTEEFGDTVVTQALRGLRLKSAP